MLMIKSGLGDSNIKGDDSYCVKILIVYCLMLHVIYVTLVIRLWDLQLCCYTCGVRHGLTLAIFPILQKEC